MCVWGGWGMADMNRGILGSGHTEAFLLALYEKWRECDKSQMELTANWCDFLRLTHTHTQFFFSSSIILFGKNTSSCFALLRASGALQLSCVHPASILRYLKTFVWLARGPRAEFGRQAGADGDRVHNVE